MFLLPLLISSVHATEWTSKYGSQSSLGYSGPLSFGRLPYVYCLEDTDMSQAFDIAVLGVPFDTTTSYRSGARFGPRSIRLGGQRLLYTLDWGKGPLDEDAVLVDCGDIPVTPMDNTKALDQIQVAYSTLLAKPAKGGSGPRYKSRTAKLALDRKEHPRVVALGGDHTITLPVLRALYQVYGPISVIHFGSHLDTSNVTGLLGQARVTHGSYFAIAHEEGLLSNTSIHAGIRQKMRGLSQIEHDRYVNFQIISAEDIDDYGIENVVRKIRERVGEGGGPVYLSLDIDVIDPGLAPATGTPEAGGWTTREVKRILRGLSGLNYVGMDIVEVAPAYDGGDEMTSRAAASIITDFLNMMQTDEVPVPHGERPRPRPRP